MAVETSVQTPELALLEEAAASELRTRGRSARRLVTSYGLTIALLVTLNFFLPRALPGDPIDAMQDPVATTYVHHDATRVALARYYGLDRPLLAQYGHYVAGLARGDLGLSVRYHAPVRDVVAARLPWTLLLMGTAIALALTVGLVAGVNSGWRRGGAGDRSMLGLFIGLNNVPAFFLASAALFGFSVRLRSFPVAGARTPFSSSGGIGQVADVARHLVLPASVLGLGLAAGYYLLMRASMVSELGSDYLLLGRIKGLGERTLKYRYAARNAVLPVVAAVALEVGFAVTGAIFVERVFAYPGMGRLLFDSIAARDYPALQGCFLVLTVTVVTANFCADVVCRRLDPRTVT